MVKLSSGDVHVSEKRALPPGSQILRKMALDNAEERENVRREMEKWQEKIVEVEEEWKKKMIPLHVQKDE